MLVRHRHRTAIPLKSLKVNMKRILSLSILCVLSLWFSASAYAEADKDYEYPGQDKAGGDAPDKEVPGWLVNLGPSGARAIITKNSFIVRYIFKDSPAVGRLNLGDEIVGVFGKPFNPNPVLAGRFAYDGPIMEFGQAIEKAEGKDGKLILNVTRASKTVEVTINLEAIGTFSPTFPINCKKSELLRARALNYFVDHPEADGACNTRSAICLALLSSDDPKHQASAKQRIQKWATELPNKVTWTWPAAYQLITLGEYYVITKDPSVLPTMKLDVEHLEYIQYKLPVALMNGDGKLFEKGKSLVVNGVTFDYYKLYDALQLYDGGFGHGGPGGYGPMQYTTILAMIGWQLAERCGLTVTPARMESAFKYIHHGTNASGNVGYGSEFIFGGYSISDPEAYMRGTGGERAVGKSGAALIAHKLAAERPDSTEYINKYKNFYKIAYSGLPNGHADGNLNIFWGFVGAGAADDDATLRTTMDYYKAWINTARCFDGSFVVQPNRHAGDDDSYYRSSRYGITGSLALALGIGAPKLIIQGIQVSIPGVNPKALKGKLDIAYKAIVSKDYDKSAVAIKSARSVKTISESDAAICTALSGYLDAQSVRYFSELEALEKKGNFLGLQAAVTKIRANFGLLEGFKEKIQHYDEGLLQDEWKAQIKLGARYVQLMTAMKNKPNQTKAKDLDVFAEKNTESLYGKWAAEVVKIYREEGRVVDPSASKAPAPVAPVAKPAK